MDEEIPQTTNLITLGEELLDQAQDSRHGRAARSVRGGDAAMRQTLMALTADTELAEHEAPEDAILYVLMGDLRVITSDHEWELSAGDVVPIPQARHAVQADTDVVFLLTVLHR
ncbi:cupin domain-containing protein [Nesterenkonia marinintestina]|uniref:cupin domain-containing protein n=1 Tax=Nesterenkonia marinintestina TaxID=2979865 RepID=UPI0021BE9F7B|nr:cupin domain-containing protein [Nesterenkonia sp. GX14115]